MQRAAGAVVADRLLELLSSDDAFRKLFTRNPGEALAQAGFVNTTYAPSPQICFWGIELASKEQIAQARDEIRRMLTGGLSQSPIQLDAGAGASLRK
jgi:putative modified peptide